MLADQAQIENYTSTQEKVFRFNKKDYLYLNDQQAGQFSGQVQFTTTSWVNGALNTNLAECLVEIPYSITVNPGTAGTVVAPAYATPCVVWKNGGFLNLFNSAMITINGQQITQQSKGLNVYNSYNIMTQWNKLKEQRDGPLIHFAMDTSVGSFTANQGALSSVNNVVTPALGSVDLGTAGASMTTAYNEGAYKRALYMYQANQGGTNQYYTWDNATGQIVIRGYALIPLSYIHPVFRQMNYPVRNLNMQLYLNLNSFNISVSGAGPVWNVGNSAQTWSSPLMITDTMTYAIGGNLVTNGSVVLALGANASLDGSNFTGGPARLYYPCVKLSPTADKELITHHIKTTIFEDFQPFQLLNSVNATNGNVSWIITNGVQNLKKVVFFCYASALTAGSGNVPSLLSITGPEPILPTPGGVCLTNIQLLINGQNYWSNYVQYGFEQYMFHNAEFNVGGIVSESSEVVSSGLMSAYDWSNNKIYAYDVTRNEGITTQDTPVSIQLIATNISPFPIDIYCYAIFESTIELNMKSQQLTMVQSKPNISIRS